ncbi:hypothetical protein BN946_scf184842.g22 [Trametes cinnabarina]|uniref:Sas10 C-terminal domain-containing protein n=1 Tax=Pycnoporus cinnabarinus TaxID=5643 RepID=A0A060S7K2_PYCCI|nr:hypothetical protein BN946_scf184842.g22 [Trametes cinnabarina]
MVRRRSGKGKAAHSKPRGVNRKDSKMVKWNTAEDIPMDEEDQFHASRDKILLEGDDHGGSDDGDEDEVFALKGMPEDESEDEEEDGYEGGAQYEDDEDDIDGIHYAAAEAAQKEKKKQKAKAKGKKGKKGGDESDEQDDGSDESESEEEGWGTKKSAYYSSNAQEIDSEDEEAIELEEQEAKRLQTKAREAMAEDDFGLDDVAEGLPETDGIVDEPAQPTVQQLPQDKQSLLRHLEKTNPEALALANDWDDVAHGLMKAQAKIAKLEAEDPAALSLSMMHLHYQALLTYATTLAFYLHLRASEKYIQRPELLRSHPILPRLLQLKQSLVTLEDLDFAASSDDEDESGLSGEDDLSLDEDDLSLDEDELMEDARTFTSARRTGARSAAIGGDDDIPYRERKKEKEARIAKEVAKAREGAGADLDDVDPELEMDAAEKKAKKRRREESESEDEGGEADGYYELVKRKSKEKKEKKKQEYEAARAADRYVEEESVDGPRSLTRAILKNKGLTPKRSKSVRNPRVKKRQKYEKAKKKVASQKAIYRGGVDANRYTGEKTGISQTVKSVRL